MGDPRAEGLTASNDDADETQLEPAPEGQHNYVTLQAGMSLCDRCGDFWDWRDEQPTDRCNWVIEWSGSSARKVMPPA